MGILKPKNMFGIDVSHHQGKIDWAKVSQNSPMVDFAFIKASTGVGSQDPRFLINATQVKQVGIKVGYYHYATLNKEDEMLDAKSEAEWFISVIRQAPISDLPLILDIEDDNPKVDLDGLEVLNYIKTFFNTLAANGYSNYALYSYTPFLVSRLPSNHDLSNIRLWIAAYTNKPTPVIPKQWKEYWIWQYSAKGKVNGISTNVDLNKTSKVL